MKNEKIMVVCPKCKKHKTTEGVKARPVGYKGQVQFYINCECGSQIIVSEKWLPRTMRRKLLASCLI